MEFNHFKNIIVAKCKEKSACVLEFKKLLKSSNSHELWSILLSNYEWCNRNNIFPSEERPKEFVFDKEFNGSLDLRGCDLDGVTLPTSVGGSLDLRGCDLKGITLPTNVGGFLDLQGCDLKGITLPTNVDGSLYLQGCDLKGVTLPTSVGSFLDLRGCDLKGVTLPTSVGRYLYLQGCDNVSDEIKINFGNKIIWQ